MDQFDILAQSITRQVKRWAASLSGCAHTHTSIPITLTGGEISSSHRVCTRCGKQLPYDRATISKAGPKQ